MAISWPAAFDTLVNPTAASPDTNPPHATQHADLNDFAEAVEAELGLLPSGSFTTVRERLEAIEADIADLGTDVATATSDAAAATAAAAAVDARVDTVETDLAGKADAAHDHDGEYTTPTEADVLAVAAAQGAVEGHEDSTNPHGAAGYLAVMRYDGSAWTISGGARIWQRTVGDPDPTASMADGDLLVDASS